MACTVRIREQPSAGGAHGASRGCVAGNPMPLGRELACGTVGGASIPTQGRELACIWWGVPEHPEVV